MKKTFSTLCFILAIHSVCFSQTSSQILLNTSSSVGVETRAAIIMDDGGSALLLDSAGSTRLWRANDQGIPTWSMALPGAYHQWTACTAPNGGLLLMGKGQSTFVDSPFLVDTLHMATMVVLLDASGNPEWVRRVEWSIRDHDLFNQQNHCQAICTAGGGCYLLLSGEDGNHSLAVNIVKLSDAGVLEWSRFIGSMNFNFQPIMIDPSVDFMLSVAGVDNDLWVTRPGMGGLFERSILHLSGNGDQCWKREYRYTNDSQWHMMSHGVPLEGGDILFHGTIVLVSGQYAMANRVAPSGELLRTDLYGPQFHAERGFSMGGGQVLLNGGPRYVVIGDDAEVMGASMIQEGHNGQSTYDLSAFSFAPVGGSVQLGGQLVSQHDVFGTLIRYPTIWEFDPLNPDGCMMVPTSADHILVPDSLMQVTLDTTYGAIPSNTITTDTTFVPQFVTPIGTNELCAVVVSVAEPPQQPSLSVLQTMIPAGQPLKTRCGTAATMTLVGADGRVHRRVEYTAAGQWMDIATNGLCQGTYLLRAIDHGGNTCTTVRVIVVNY